MSELTCHACGRAMREGARFCTGCGAPSAPVIVVEAQPPTRAGVRTRAGGRSRSGDTRAAGRSRGVGPRVAPVTLGAPAGSSSGAPDALGAAFDGVRTVGLGARLGAFLLDTVAVVLVAGAVLAATTNPALAGIVAAELAVGLVVWEARTGRTIGNLALGLRASRQESPYAPGLARATSRALVLLAGHLVAGIGQWVVIGSVGGDRGPLRQGWHDKAGRAVVVDVRGPRAEVGRVAAPMAAGQVPGGRALDGQVLGAQVLGAQVRGAQVRGAQVRGAQVLGGAGAGAPVTGGPVAGGSGNGRPTTPGRTTGAPVPATHAPAPQAPARPRTFVLTLDTGEAMSVSGPGVIGRAPRPRDGERCDHVVTIDDPERSLSRTHARFGIDARGFWVADAGSGNGTVAVLPSGQSLVVGPDSPTHVPSGSTIRIGDRTVLVELLG